MALIDNATLVVGAGNFYTSATGQAFPTDPLAVASPWENVGHTSIEDVFGIEEEGGEATVLGTLQNRTLRTRYSDRVETFNFILQQFDEDSLKLYFGANAVAVSEVLLGVPATPEPTEGAFLAIFIDGDEYFCFYAPKAELFRGDAMALEDTESLAGLPIKVTPLQHNTNTWTYAVTPIGGVTV